MKHSGRTRIETDPPEFKNDELLRKNKRIETDPPEFKHDEQIQKTKHMMITKKYEPIKFAC